MKALITGASGTVGTALRTHLEALGHDVVGWDRAHIPIDQYAVMEAYVRGVAPDVVFHLAIASRPTGRTGEGWLVNHDWPSELAWICRQTGARLVFTSSVMVFTDAARGPFTPEAVPDAREGYGFEKLQAEARVRSQDPQARVVRLGWQIGEVPGSNTMADFAARQAAQGVIRASTRWLPACSFLQDTAAALVRAAELPPGLYLADANRRWSFFQILTALRDRLGANWRLEPSEDFVYDQRMIDPRLPLTPLEERLPALR
ncbi:MAG: sugar nucleotide-binding protein [Anaeromyxobacter sp.]